MYAAANVAVIDEVKLGLMGPEMMGGEELFPWRSERCRLLNIFAPKISQHGCAAELEGACVNSYRHLDTPGDLRDSSILLPCNFYLLPSKLFLLSPHGGSQDLSMAQSNLELDGQGLHISRHG